MIEKVLEVREMATYEAFVDQFTVMAEQYMSYVRNNERVVIDLKFNNNIDVQCSRNLFGRLLVEEKLRAVMCRNISDQSVYAIFTGVQKTFKIAYPNGVFKLGGVIKEPQVEITEVEGDYNVKEILFPQDTYELIK